jgi:hypothetical protein
MIVQGSYDYDWINSTLTVSLAVRGKAETLHGSAMADGRLSLVTVGIDKAAPDAHLGMTLSRTPPAKTKKPDASAGTKGYE